MRATALMSMLLTLGASAAVTVACGDKRSSSGCSEPKPAEGAKLTAEGSTDADDDEEAAKSTCAAGDGSEGTGEETGDKDESGGDGGDDDTDGDDDGDDDGAIPAEFKLTGMTRAALCKHFKDDFANKATTVYATEPSKDSCTPGKLTPEAVLDIRRRIDWFRAFYGFDPLPAPKPEYLAEGQACALIMAATEDLTHDPEEGATECWTELGKAGAGASNLSLGNTHQSAGINDFVWDAGNETTLGHRRWLLYPAFKGLGYGYVNLNEGASYLASSTCVRTFGETFDDDVPVKPVPYPPPGAYLRQLVTRHDDFEDADVQTDWSISMAGADYDGAAVSIKDQDGQAVALAVDLETMTEGYGSNTARFRPSRNPADGDSWKVLIEGVAVGGKSVDVSYQVDFEDCQDVAVDADVD